MMEIERPKIDTESLSADGRYGKFVVEPLERGFGTTLGNSLRRVLLSSLPGVAVTSIKIDGVVHEFSTVEGVKEDVTEIVLNVKGITAKLYTDTPKTVRIEATGECEVTAGSIQQDAEIEILNPDWHIATPVSYTHLRQDHLHRCSVPRRGRQSAVHHQHDHGPARVAGRHELADRCRRCARHVPQPRVLYADAPSQRFP